MVLGRRMHAWERAQRGWKHPGVGFPTDCVDKLSETVGATYLCVIRYIGFDA